MSNPVLQLQAIAKESQHQLAAAQNRSYELAIKIAEKDVELSLANEAVKQLQEKLDEANKKIEELRGHQGVAGPQPPE